MDLDKKEAARRRKANQRARERGEIEPYPSEKRKQEEDQQITTLDLNLATEAAYLPSPIEIEGPKKSARTQVMQEAQEMVRRDQESHGQRYKSEALSYTSLFRIFNGVDYKGNSEEEEIRGQKRKRKLPNPSKSEILGSLREFDEWLDLRDGARKDLFWLGKEVLKKDLVESVHRVICEQFVQKNFDGVYSEGYTIGQVHRAIDRQERYDENGIPTKELILLDSRGHYKSTIDGIDVISWLINVPDIRILILTGEKKLGVAFMTEIKGYLYLAEGSDPNDMHLLFPEYILRGIDGTSKEPFVLPCRKCNQKEPSLWINSIDSNLSGWHCDIKKLDDVVTDENSNTKDVREALKEKVDGTDNLLDEFGFADAIGTRYWTDDWYGTRLATMATDNPIKYFCRQCWTVKPPYMEVLLRDLTEEMVTLTFPEKSTFKSLRKKLLLNERSFRNQQLNQPVESGEDDGYRLSFKEDVLRAHLYQASAAPKIGDLFVCWDWALSATKTSDYSVGVCARVYKDEEKNLYGLSILEIDYGKWAASELAYHIVAFEKKWKPKKTLIEKSNGAELLELEIRRQALRYNVDTLDVFWKPPSSQDNAKRNRIKGLETLLSDNRLWFVSGPWIDETFKQLTNYTGEKRNRGRKEDIADAMAYLCFFMPKNSVDSVDPEEAKKMMEEQKEQAKLKAQYDAMFGPPQQLYSLHRSDFDAAGNLKSPEPVIENPGASQDPRARFGIPGLRFTAGQ